MAGSAREPFLHLHATTVDSLGADVVSGALAAGTVFSAEDLSARYSVSRTVIREAVRVLESMNLLDVRKRRGITVLAAAAWNSLDPTVIRWQLAGPARMEKLQALSELREAVEPMAAQLAATRATPEQCGALTGAVIGMAATARAANAQTYLTHDIEFHRTLLQASGNDMLRGLSEVVAAVLRGRTEHHLMPAVANVEAVALHADVAAAVQAGDAPAARVAMQRIVTEAATAVRELSSADQEAANHAR